jgi:hypothetical protein
MKTKLIPLLAALTALTASAVHAAAIGKGGYLISKPGKYTLMRNLTAQVPASGIVPIGIRIEASDVELDLCGFTIAPLAGQEGTGVGISIAANVERVHVQNGRIRDFAYGVFGGDVQNSVTDCGFERLQINRTTECGIQLHGSGHLIRGCAITSVAANSNGVNLIMLPLGLAEVSDCTFTSAVYGGNAIASIGIGVTAVRRCVVNRFFTAYALTDACKLFDNLSLGCVNLSTGNPKMIGANN